MYILPAIVRPGGELDTEEFDGENDDQWCSGYLGQVWIRGEPTIDELGKDRVDEFVEQSRGD